MAGDWIKVEDSLPDKPEVIMLAELLNLDQDAIVGKLIRLWIWADQQTYSGNAPSVTLAFLDRCTFCAGFGAALKMVGWLIESDGGLTFPNFEYHNGQTAKQRALTAKRVAIHRRKSNAARNGASVTPSLPEKRREEKNTNTPPNPPKGVELSAGYIRKSKRPPKVDPIEELERRHFARKAVEKGGGK